MLPLVSVIILNMNGVNLVRALVKSISESSYKNIQIVLADNGSTDGSKELDKELGITVVHLKKNRGTDAYNHAYKKTKGEFILIIGNDMKVERDSIKILVEFMIKNEKVGLAVPKFFNYHKQKIIDCAGNWLSRSFYAGLHKTDYLGDKPKKIPYGIGVLRRSAIEEFGYIMDPKYFLYSEDLDLGCRLWISGWEVWYVPSSIMYHMGSISRQIFTSNKLAFLSERNMLRTFLTSLKLKKICKYLPYVLLMRVIAIMHDIFSLRFKVVFYRMYGIIWPLINIKTVLEKRKVVQNKRKVDDSKLMSLCLERFLFFR